MFKMPAANATADSNHLLLSLLMSESSLIHCISGGAVTSDDDVTEQSSRPGEPGVITVSAGSTANRSELNSDPTTHHSIILEKLPSVQDRGQTGRVTTPARAVIQPLPRPRHAARLASLARS